VLQSNGKIKSSEKDPHINKMSLDLNHIGSLKSRMVSKILTYKKYLVLVPIFVVVLISTPKFQWKSL
jgi:hypothetical protein